MELVADASMLRAYAVAEGESGEHAVAVELGIDTFLHMPADIVERVAASLLIAANEAKRKNSLRQTASTAGN